jgi:hypothetical protein
MTQRRTLRRVLQKMMALRNCEGVVKIAQRVELPVLLFDGDEELFNPFKCQFIALDEDANRNRS